MKCQICDTTTKNLPRHIRENHSNKQKPLCEFCCREFLRKDNLIRHHKTCQMSPEKRQAKVKTNKKPRGRPKQIPKAQSQYFDTERSSVLPASSFAELSNESPDSKGNVWVRGYSDSSFEEPINLVQPPPSSLHKMLIRLIINKDGPPKLGTADVIYLRGQESIYNVSSVFSPESPTAPTYQSVYTNKSNDTLYYSQSPSPYMSPTASSSAPSSSHSQFASPMYPKTYLPSINQLQESSFLDDFARPLTLPPIKPQGGRNSAPIFESDPTNLKLLSQVAGKWRRNSSSQ